LTRIDPRWRESPIAAMLQKRFPAMLRLPLLLAISMLGLCACNEDDNDDDPIVPTPVPVATPTPTPSDSAGSIDGIDTNGDGVIDGNDDITDDGSGGSVDNVGAPMTADDELVGVSSIDSTGVTRSLLTIVRSNGEIWEFVIPGIPTTRISSTITYRNVNLVFGATTGEIIFEDGSISQIDSSQRIQ
jgi:hypothetical protein